MLFMGSIYSESNENSALFGENSLGYQSVVLCAFSSSTGHKSHWRFYDNQSVGFTSTGD